MPLAHILLPQLAKKAEEITAQLPGTPNGYLQQSTPVPVEAAPTVARKGGQATSRGKEQLANSGGVQSVRTMSPAEITKHNAMAKKMGLEQIEDYDPRLQNPLYNYQNAVGQLPGFLGHQTRLNAAGLHPVPSVPEMQALEQGVLTAPTDVKPYKKGTPLKFLPGEPVAMTESGFGVDKKGKRLGYIDQEALNPGIRYLDRRPTDLGLGGGSSKGATKPSFGQDIDAQDMLGQMYGSYLRDFQGNNNKFFPEMFLDSKGNKRPAAEIDNIKKGVKVLIELQRGDKT